MDEIRKKQLTTKYKQNKQQKDEGRNLAARNKHKKSKIKEIKTRIRTRMKKKGIG